MVTSEKDDLVWVLELQGEEEADDLETVLALVNVVTKENIIIGVDILGWRLPDIKEPHQVDVLSMDVTEDLGWRPDLLENDWLLSKHVCALVGQLDNMLLLQWELVSWFDVLSFLWLEQSLQEHLAQDFMWIFIDFNHIFLLRV